MWQKEKLLILSNFFLGHFVFKKLSAAEPSESVYMRERVNAFVMTWSNPHLKLPRVIFYGESTFAPTFQTWTFMKIGWKIWPQSSTLWPHMIQVRPCQYLINDECTYMLIWWKNVSSRSVQDIFSKIWLSDPIRSLTDLI